jgi:deoxyribodipyrimidine photolyase
MADVSIYWFRDDLRLADLPGLAAAAQAGPSSRFSCETRI